MLSLTWLLSIIPPIGLVVGGAMLIRKRGNPDTAEQRYFLFLAWTVIGMSVPIFVNWIFPQLRFSIGVFFAPLIPALVAIMLLHARSWQGLSGRQKGWLLSIPILLLLIGVAQFLFGKSVNAWRRLETTLQILPYISIPIFLSIIWKWGSQRPILFGMISIFYLMVFNWFELGSLPLPDEATLSSIFSTNIMALTYLVIPGFILTTVAMLVIDTIKPSGVTKGQILGHSLMVLVLLSGIIYTYIWLWIWDGMDDGVRFILLWMATALTAVSIGLMIGMISIGWRRWLGIPFAGAVLALIYGSVVGIGNKYSNYVVTEERAQHIQDAIESFHAKTSWYPLDLSELTPREMLRIPRPMIVPGQNWCYQGGPNYFRLGLVYREHWSSPYFSVRVYASAGNIPDGSWECDERLVEVKTEYQAGFNEPPASSPLPESSTSVQMTYVEPILSGTSFSVGDWSPDGRYLVFGKTEYFMDEVEQVKIDLYFIDSTTGSICQPPESKWTVQESDGLQGHYAWLSDVRFLFVTDIGEMWTFKPCATKIEDLPNHYSNTFTGIASFDENNGNVLLKDKDGYRLLNGSSLEVRRIADVPAESYRDFYSWSADGKRLAISTLTGAEEGQPAFLYVVNVEAGDVVYVQSLQGVSDAYLPIVEWLTPDDLLLHSKTLTVMDFHTNPPSMTDLIHDIFLLDIEYPNDISSMDSHPGMDGYDIGIRVNLPRNQNVYLYESKTEQVTVYEHDTHSMFFFPDGGWMFLSKWEDAPTYTDEYEMVWLDRPDDAHRLMVEGHVPRSYPQLFPRYLPNTSHLIFSSSQGISLVSIPNGETLRFWVLRGAERSSGQVSIPPMENTIIVFAGEVGVYYLSLTE